MTAHVFLVCYREQSRGSCYPPSEPDTALAQSGNPRTPFLSTFPWKSPSVPIKRARDLARPPSTESGDGRIGIERHLLMESEVLVFSLDDPGAGSTRCVRSLLSNNKRELHVFSTKEECEELLPACGIAIRNRRDAEEPPDSWEQKFPTLEPEPSTWRVDAPIRN